MSNEMLIYTEAEGGKRKAIRKNSVVKMSEITGEMKENDFDYPRDAHACIRVKDENGVLENILVLEGLQELVDKMQL